MVISSASTLESGAHQPWRRLAQESGKAYSAFVTFCDLGSERTYEKVARKLQKSEPLIARWGKKHNWHHRAVDLDEFNAQEMQRELRSRRIRSRKRSLDIADKLTEKLAEAVELLESKRVTQAGGKPDVVEAVMTPNEIASLFRVVTDVQQRLLGEDENEEVYEFHLHVVEDPRYASEQPEAVLAARQKAKEEREQFEEEAM